MSQESAFEWKPVEGKSAFGNITRPMALLEIKVNDGEWKPFYAEVDSGSPITVFNESDSERLGIELEKGRPVTLRGVLGGKCLAYVHEVEMRIGKEEIRAKVAFTEGPNHKQLLGRIDVFDGFRVCLSGKAQRTSFLRE